MTIHLGGTCGNSIWRELFIPMLNKNTSYINPVVKNWAYSEKTKMDKQKRMDNCDFLLYVITPE